MLRPRVRRSVPTRVVITVEADLLGRAEGAGDEVRHSAPVDDVGQENSLAGYCQGDLVLQATTIVNKTCLCEQIEAALDPTQNANGEWELNDLTPDQLQEFAATVKAECGSGSGYVACTGYSVHYDINADGDTDTATATSATSDLCVAIAGDGTTTPDNGGNAQATNSKQGGAAVAVAGDGSASTYGNGGDATATANNSSGGGDAVAQGGDGGVGNPEEPGGNGGDGTASSTNSSGVASSGTGNGGVLEPPAQDPQHGNGGNAEAGPGEHNDDGSTFGNNTTNGDVVNNA